MHRRRYRLSSPICSGSFGVCMRNPQSCPFIPAALQSPQAGFVQYRHHQQECIMSRTIRRFRSWPKTEPLMHSSRMRRMKPESLRSIRSSHPCSTWREISRPHEWRLRWKLPLSSIPQTMPIRPRTAHLTPCIYPAKKIAGLKQLNPIYIRILIDYILTQQYAVCHYDRYLSHDS